LATEYGFDPEQILDWSPTVYQAVLMVHEFRVKEAQKAQRKKAR
jgi:hypothetical protein